MAVVRCDVDGGHLLLHLGMSGSLRVLPPGTPAGKHDHFDLELGDRLLRPARVVVSKGTPA